MPRRSKAIQKKAHEGKLVLRVSSEREIAEIQLHRLRQKSLLEELTLEDIKKYDLLVKNLMLLGGSTDGELDINTLKDTSDAELVEAVKAQLPDTSALHRKLDKEEKEDDE
jgi:hypothetical protein